MGMSRVATNTDLAGYPVSGRIYIPLFSFQKSAYRVK